MGTILAGVAVERTPGGALGVEIGSPARALFLRKVWRRVKRGARRARRWVRRTVRRAGSRARKVFRGVRRAVGRATSAVKRKARGAYRWVRRGIRRAGAKITRAWSRAKSWLRKTGKKVADKIVTGYNAVRTFTDPSGYIQACARRSKHRITGPCNGSRSFCNRRYDQVTQAMTHNSMAALKYTWTPGYANHCQKITTQLDDGIRGLMLDSHEWKGKTWLCHGSCNAGRIDLVKGLSEIRRWLERNPEQVVTINWENGISGAQMADAMRRSGLMPYVYQRPSSTAAWPTLGEMIRTGKRVVLFTSGNAGAFPGYHSVRSNTWENGYSYKRVRDFGCTARYTKGPVFTLNHFLTNPTSAPHLAKQANRRAAIVAHARACQRQVGLKPTFVAVDWYELGDVLQAVKALNGR